MQDKFLQFFGAVCSKKALAYGKVDQSRLPDDVRELLQSYSLVLIALCAGVIVPVFTLNVWSVVFCVPLVAGCFVLKHQYEKKLDPLLAPFITGNAP